MKRSETAHIAVGAVSVTDAAVAGAVLGAAIAFARWWTWEPATPFGAVDAIVCTAALSALAIVLRLDPFRRHASSTIAFALASVGGLAWLQSVPPGGLVRLAALGAFGAGLLIMAASAFTRRRQGLPVAVFATVLGVGLVASLVPGSWRLLCLAFPLAVVAAALAGPPREGSRVSRLTAATVAAAIVMVSLLLVRPGSGQVADLPRPGEPAQEGASVILIVLDTVRRDHLSLYGYDRPTTPRIDSWAEGAMVYDNATANSSWTLPAHASMFTGLYSRTHGTHGFRGSGPRRLGSTTQSLGLEFETTAEALSKNGWATGAVVANHGFLSPAFQLDQGFDTYWASAPRRGVTFAPSEWLLRSFASDLYVDYSWPYYRDRFVVDNAIQWLDAARDRPFFLFVNLFDAHYPYYRKPDETFPEVDERPLSDYFPEFATAPGTPPALRHETRRYSEELIHRFVSEDAPLDPGVRRYLVNGYDRELAHLDRELARLFEYLEQSGLASTTYVVLTSDHGEYFGEHGLVFHSKHLHEEVIAVPFVLRGPGIEPGRTDRPVQHVDVMPSILALLGVEQTTRSDGVPLSFAEPSVIVSEWYAATWPAMLAPEYEGRFDRDLVTLKDGHWKLIEYEGGRVELFDLRSDPGESRDVAETEPDRRDRMRAAIEAWRARTPHREVPVDGEQIDPKALERLRALGYIGGGTRQR